MIEGFFFAIGLFIAVFFLYIFLNLAILIFEGIVWLFGGNK